MFRTFMLKNIKTTKKINNFKTAFITKTTTTTFKILKRLKKISKKRGNIKTLALQKMLIQIKFLKKEKKQEKEEIELPEIHFHTCRI